MSRRSKPTNRYGCKPDADVCVEHDEPLVCRHGCSEAEPHKCNDQPDRQAAGKQATDGGGSGR